MLKVKVKEALVFFVLMLQLTAFYTDYLAYII